MCGLVGIQRSEGQVERDRLLGMLDTLVHRGPDGQGVYLSATVGLGHRRLSIIDLAGGDQPFVSEGGGLALVANGEIYNHVELRQSLEEKGHRFSSHSDCETILHAYAEYGDDCLAHLQGMFAFALYDKANRRLLLARDRLGMKPLFLARQAGGVAFASELKALLPALEKPVDIDAFALLQYLQNQNSSGRETIIEGVERILPGEALVVEEGEVAKRWRYWSALGVSTEEKGFEQACSEFDALMETVMRQHMRSDVPFGLFLSGGVDSTTLLGLLSRYKEEPIRTFSVGFPNSSVGDELETAQTIAKHFNSRHTVLRPAAEAMLQRLPYSVWAADDLMRDFANLPTSLLAEQASRELKVVFSGEGGDEAFAGYGRYRINRFERGLKNLLAGGSGGFRTGANFRGKLPSQVFGEKLLRTGRSWREPLIQAWRETPVGWSDLQRMQYVDLVTALPDNLLVKADRMLMAWSLEGRLPFVDHRVIEFGLSLPDRLKIEGKQGKAFLKRWASRFIPGDHLWQKKKGFNVPASQWLDNDYLQRLEAALLDSPAIQAWCKPDGVSQLMKRQRSHGDMTKNIFALLQFAIWHRLFVEGKGEAPPSLIDPVDFLRTGSGA